MDDRTVTLKQAVDSVNVSEKTLRRWIKDGLLEADLYPGKTGMEYRVSLNDANAVKDRKSTVLLKARRQPILEQTQELAHLREAIEEMTHSASAREQRLMAVINEQKVALEDQTREVRDLRAQVYLLQEKVIRALPTRSKPTFLESLLGRKKTN